MFTLDNTEGFTAANIEIMNAALAKLVARGIEESNASDIVNNNWTGDGDTVDSLAKMSVGRPVEMTGGKRVNVYLDAASLARAAELGGGNVSEGIRAALKC
jgi:ABC-type taurine transport system substrate-binding protein